MILGDLDKKVKEKNIPVEAAFELTWRCNLKCILCYQFPPDNNELSTNEVLDILDQLHDAGCLYLSLTGGEPLLRKDFWEIAGHARKRTFAVTLQSNGTLITPDVAQRIHEHAFMAVHISLLGASEATHDSITGIQGSFRKAMDAASMLATAGTHVVMKATLMKQNFDEFHDMEAFAKNLGAELALSPVVFPKSTGEKTPALFRLDDDQMREFYAYRFRENQTEIAPERDISTLPLCQFGRTDCCINPHGKVYPCVAVPLEVGDLKKQKFSAIWEHSDILKKIRCATMGDLVECSKCSLLPSCVRCSGMAFLEEGSVFSVPHECCRMARIMEEVTRK